MVYYIKLILIITTYITIVSSTKLKYCVVDGRGGFKKSDKYCNILDAPESQVECVVAADRLDCLRRILKGKVDFAVFNAEDLVAATNLYAPLLITNELQLSDDENQYQMVVVVNNESGIKSRHDLVEKKFCHPGYDSEPDSNKIISNYLEASAVLQECNPSLTLSENRIRASSKFFKAACKAGPWVHDRNLDYELKRKYQNLCSLCDIPYSCGANDKYWGRRGPLLCLTDGVGDFAWARLDDTKSHFGISPGPSFSSPNGYSYMCPDGNLVPLNTTNPCIWVVKPWPVVAAVKTRAEEVQNLVSNLKYDDKTLWKASLLSLIEFYHVTIKKLDPIESIESFFNKATGFLSANSFTGCHPPRTIKMCTTSNLEYSKCGSLQEAAAVYGIEPDVDCVRADNITHCMMALNDSFVDIVMVPPNLLHKAQKEYQFQTVFYETVDEVDKYLTVPVVKAASSIKTMEDLRGTRACFPEYDGVAWNTIIAKLRSENLLNKCPRDDGLKDYFSEICFGDAQEMLPKNFGKKCVEGYVGDIGALHCLSEDYGDVAFISKNNLEQFNKEKKKWNADFRLLCKQDDEDKCHLSWSPVGQGMTSKNKTNLWIKDALDVFLQFDNLFGKKYRTVTKSFSLFGPFDGKSNVLFHDATVNFKNVPTSRNMETMNGFYGHVLDDNVDDNCVMSKSDTITFNLLLLINSVILLLLLLRM